jgi:predicted RecA/RadA family phage recombinase
MPAQATFKKEGFQRIDYVADADMVNGEVRLIGDLGIGVCEHDTKSGELTSLNIADVFRINMAAVSITKFARLYWDNTAKKLTTSTASGANKLAAVALEARADTDTTVLVKLLGLSA